MTNKPTTHSIEVKIKVEKRVHESEYSTTRNVIIETSRDFNSENSLKGVKAKLLGMIAECKLEAMEELNNTIEKEVEAAETDG